MTHTPHRLEVENASIGYGDKTVLHDLTFNIPHGARVAVVGPNGAGKSTLFKALVGLLSLQKGRILIHGLSISAHKDCVAYVPQREEVDWRFPVTVNDVVMMGRFDYQGWFRGASHADKLVVDKSLAQMGIANLSRRSISDHILLMDEPFTGVDAPTQEVTLNLLDDLHKANVTTMIATHDLNLAASRFDLLLLLNNRLIAFGTPEEVLKQENLIRAFGSQLTVLADGSVVIDQCCPPEEEHEHHTETVK